MTPDYGSVIVAAFAIGVCVGAFGACFVAEVLGLE